MVGNVGSVTATVHDEDTAVALGSGDVPVLGTPRLVALMEAAAVEAVRDHVQPGSTTVGTRIEVDHLAPSPVGSVVTATAEVTEVDGRKIVFDLSVHQDDALVGRGRHVRVVVARERFLSII